MGVTVNGRGEAAARNADEAEFGDYVAGHLDGLRSTVFLLCGDWHHAEDIVQTALARVFLAWRRIREFDALDAYVRKTVVRTYFKETRRAWRRREQGWGNVPEPAAAEDLTDDRLILRRAMAEVPARQRAALVLRYWDDLSVEQTADAMGCSAGTVKSSTARGLTTLRAVLARQGFAVEPFTPADQHTEVDGHV